jgi:hypothetical protein
VPALTLAMLPCMRPRLAGAVAAQHSPLRSPRAAPAARLTARPLLPPSPPLPAGAEAPEDLQLDQKKLRAAIKRQEALLAGEVADDRKRGFNSLGADKLEVTEEDMEAYRLKKARADDPMAAPGSGTRGYDML